jgi:hypothetical protein
MSERVTIYVKSENGYITDDNISELSDQGVDIDIEFRDSIWNMLSKRMSNALNFLDVTDVFITVSSDYYDNLDEQEAKYGHE